MLNKLEKCHKRLEYSLVLKQDSPKAFQAVIKAFLRHLDFYRCYLHTAIRTNANKDKKEYTAVNVLSAYLLRSAA